METDSASQSPFLRVITNIILEPFLFMLDKFEKGG